MKYILFSLLLSSLSFTFFQQHDTEITGIITDANTGQPVAQASVHTKNGSYRTVSDTDGVFTLKIPVNIKSIVISAVGYETQEIGVEGKHHVTVSLKASQARLEEVVVAGYGITGRVAGIAVAKGMRRSRASNAAPIPQHFNTEDYDAISENKFLEALQNPLSTFSIDVDGASYSNVRRFLNMGQLPPAGSVRIEEMINYFHYSYPQPKKGVPFSVHSEVAECPWNDAHKLVMIGLQGKKIDVTELPPSNLVFLVDVSGSMMDENKLPLVKSSMKLLIEQLREQDRVSIVTYAGNAGLVLPSTSGDNKRMITDALEALEAGGSTAGGAGIRLAYDVARKNLVSGGNNRVILCTDGDFNVGVSSDAELERIIEQERKSGVFLTVLGYGMGNYKDNKMQKLANKGNGNHAYIDNINEARKVLVAEFGGTLFTIAEDVKLQVEFNPAIVQAYRLIGYENRILAKEDFNNDKKDAGEIGSGHTVTALYEVIPLGIRSEFIHTVDPLKYQENKQTGTNGGKEMMHVKIRYKDPRGEVSKLLQHAVANDGSGTMSNNFRFAAAVAQYGMLLSNSEFRQNSSFASAIRLARESGNDEEGYRREFISLAKKAASMMKEKDVSRK